MLTVAALSWLGTAVPVDASDRDVEAQLGESYRRAGWKDVRIDLDGGIVTLKGEVPHIQARQQIEQEAQQISGVERVVNLVSVTRVTDDAALQATIDREIAQSATGTVFDDVSVYVIGGTVVLVGYLTEPDKLPPLTDLIGQIDGVQQVLSEVEILPDSEFDQELRPRVAAAVYGDAAGSDSPSERAGPVHIIVRDARVSLRGTVSDEQERKKVAELVRGVAGVLSVDNRLLTEAD
ncbi:MAG: BON domain-containing protein [Acidobacteriota bacterium]